MKANAASFSSLSDAVLAERRASDGAEQEEKLVIEDMVFISRFDGANEEKVGSGGGGADGEGNFVGKLYSAESGDGSDNEEAVTGSDNEEAVTGSREVGLEVGIVDAADFCGLLSAVSMILKSDTEEMAMGGGGVVVEESFTALFSVEAVDEYDKEEAATGSDKAGGKLYSVSGVGGADEKKAAVGVRGAGVESFISEIF